MAEHADAEERQNQFDAALERIRDEGVEAYKAGLTKADNPYAGHPEPHFRMAWSGGMAEAALGLAEHSALFDPLLPMK